MHGAGGSFVELRVTTGDVLDNRQQLVYPHGVVMAMKPPRTQLMRTAASP